LAQEKKLGLTATPRAKPTQPSLETTEVMRRKQRSSVFWTVQLQASAADKQVDLYIYSNHIQIENELLRHISRCITISAQAMDSISSLFTDEKTQEGGKAER